MARHFGLLTLLLALTVAGPFAGADDGRAPILTVEEIWKQLRERQTLVKSGEVRFRARRWNLYDDAPASSTARGKSRLKGVAQSETWTDWNECHVWFSGEKVGLEHLIPCFAEGSNGELVPQIDVYDGKRMQSLSRHNRPGLAPSASVAEWPASRQWDVAELMPLWLVFRPLRPELLGENPQVWMVDPQPVEIRGTRCVEVVRIQPEAEIDLETRVSFDVSHGLRPMRHSFGHAGKPLMVMDLEYPAGDPAEVVHVPANWNFTFRRPVSGKLASSGEFETVSVALNPEIADERFQIEFAAGTRVIDQDQGQESIVQENGDWKPYGPPLATRTRGTSQGQSSTAIILGVILVGFVLAAVFRQRWRSP